MGCLITDCLLELALKNVTGYSICMAHLKTDGAIVILIECVEDIMSIGTRI